MDIRCCRYACCMYTDMDTRRYRYRYVSMYVHLYMYTYVCVCTDLNTRELRFTELRLHVLQPCWAFLGC